MDIIKLNKKQKIRAILIILIIMALLIIICIDLLPLIESVVKDVKNEKTVASEITGFGLKGILILVSLNALQVVSIVFPTTPILIISGLSFGVWKGYVLTIVGVAIGNILVFILVRNFNDVFTIAKGRNYKSRVAPKSKLDFLALIHKGNPKKLAFLLFLIPGIPNGILPYIFAQTKIKLLDYVLILIVASTPASLVSIIIGDRLGKSDIKSAIIMGVVLLVISVMVILNKNKIFKYLTDSK